MKRYIEVEKLKAEIERRNLSNRYITTEGYEQELYEIIDSIQQEQPEGVFSEKPNDLLSEAAEDSWAVYEYRESPKGLYYTCYVDGFKAGAERMTGQGWFSVDESLPKMDEEVIVLSDELGTAPIYKIGFGHIVDVNRCIDYNGWNCPGVKYWMPCPKIPGMND